MLVGFVLCMFIVLRRKEAYDQCTRTCSSIREASKELLNLVPPDSLAACSTRTAISKARLLEPHIIKLEGYLFEQNRSLLSFDKIREVLCASAPLFSDLQKAEQELVELTTNEQRKKRRLI